MRKKLLILIGILLAVLIIGFYKFFNSPSENIIQNPISSDIYKFYDADCKIQMLFPNKFSIQSNDTSIAGFYCSLKKLVCNPDSLNEITLMIIKTPNSLDDSSVVKILRDNFYGFENGTNFKAGKLEGLRYKTTVCGVLVDNFIGIWNNYIYQYSETMVGDSLFEGSVNIKNLEIDIKGKDLKSFLQINKQTKRLSNRNENILNIPEQDLLSGESGVEKINIIRVDLPVKLYNKNPDTILYFVKQHYYANEGLFQRSIACNINDGTSKEIISYPKIEYEIFLFESVNSSVPYEEIKKSYTGNLSKE